MTPRPRAAPVRYYRQIAHPTLAALLAWCERHALGPPVVERGDDGTVRALVQVRWSRAAMRKWPP